MATLKDIADTVGVSVRTVRRALDEDGYVKADLGDRIREVARELGYAPNPIARSLRLGRTNEVIVVAVTVDELHMARIAGLEQALRTNNFSTGIQMVRESEITSPEALIQRLCLRRPAGVAVASRPGLNVSSLVEGLAAEGVRSVAMDSNEAVPAVRIDRAAGVEQAVHHLINSGRRQIVYVGPTHSRDRIDGYERAILQSGQRPQLYEPSGGYRQSVADILSRYPGLEAVQAYSDERALELLAGLHDAGIHVPDDVALIGFDDRWAAQYSWPPLTTVAQPSQAVGNAAAKFLIDREKEQCDEIIPTSLVVRESA